MKKIVIYTLALVISFVISSCEKLLDVKNLSVFNPGDTWNDKELANAYLTDLYATLPGWPLNNSGNVITSGFTADESKGIIGEDFLQTTNSNFKYWPFSNIRKINVLLDEIDTGTLAGDVINPIKGQAYFLRAFHYFKAVIYHGGLPIIKKPQLLTDDLLVSRNTTKECFDFIIEDLDNAISALPDKYTGNDYGRIDKAAALAFKGRVLLFKASPQFNPSNPYGNAYWQEAYTATKAAKDQLESWGYGLLSTYDDIFLKEQHKEAVLAVVFVNPGKVNLRDNLIRPETGATGDEPIWELVKSYPMADGKQPGNSSNYSYDVQTYWENRDPRFYSTIVYNGCILPLGVSPDRRQYTDAPVVGETLNRTGFYCRKGIDNSLKSSEAIRNAMDWLEIRFAEVLMNYAEAANETGHPDDALDVLKQIRQRAGIEPGSDGMYGITATTKEQIRDAIQFENRIEFAFEGMRFWQLRRLRLLHTVIHGMRKYGLQITRKVGIDQLAQDTYPDDYDYVVKETYNLGSQIMYTPESYYFFPIHKDEIEKDPNLIQNVGWEGGTFDPTLH